PKSGKRKFVADGRLHPPAKCEITLVANSANVGAARALLVRLLEVAGASGIEEPAALCATELLTNVLQHTESPDLSLAVELRESEVLISVKDDSCEDPAPSVADLDAESGRGMFIVDQLVNEWGVDRSEDRGKAVWMRMATA